MKAIILAAGRGKNLNPLTETRPKPMISICGKPVLEYIIEGLVETGNRDILMVVGHHANSIKQYFERGERFGLDLEGYARRVAAAAIAARQHRLDGCRASGEQGADLAEPRLDLWTDHVADAAEHVAQS